MKQDNSTYAIIMLHPQLNRYYRRNQYKRFVNYIRRHNIGSLPLQFRDHDAFVNFAAGFGYALPKECDRDVLMMSTENEKGTRYILAMLGNWNPKASCGDATYLLYFDERRQKLKGEIELMAHTTADSLWLHRDDVDLFIESFNKIFKNE